MADPRIRPREDRRWFYPALIQDRGKSLPFTTREKDFVPSANTKVRAKNSPVNRRRNFGRRATDRQPEGMIF